MFASDTLVDVTLEVVVDNAAVLLASCALALVTCTLTTAFMATSRLEVEARVACVDVILAFAITMFELDLLTSAFTSATFVLVADNEVV